MENGSAGGGIVTMIVYIAIIVAMVAAQWKIFEKAGKPGWAAIIPVYNLVILLEIIDRPLWWLLLVLCIGPVGMILIAMDLAENFGKSKGWGIGMLFFLGIVGYPILGFGDAQYTKISRQ